MESDSATEEAAGAGLLLSGERDSAPCTPARARGETAQ
jgi:hypothetical protein